MSDWAQVATAFIVGANYVFLAGAVAINGSYLALLVLSFFMVTGYRRSVENESWRHNLQSPLAPGVSIVVPAFNEETSIRESVTSLLSLEHPNYEIVVVNDGSKDDTLKVLIESFGLVDVPIGLTHAIPCGPILGLYRSPEHHRLVVVNKENGGSKADAMNAGLNVARMPLICAVDADSLLDGDALLRATKPFADDPDRVLAVGGIVRVANGCKVQSGRVVEISPGNSFLSLVQSVEYLRGFLFGRSGLALLRCLMIVSGAFGIFRRDALLDVGGYSSDAIGEDIDLVVKLHRYALTRGLDYRILFLPDPVCWTQAPESLKVLGGQRNRWQRGLLQTLWDHRSLCMNPRYGPVGLIAYPFYLIVEALAPVLEFLGYVIVPLSFFLGIINWELLVLFLTLSIFAGLLLSTGAVVLEELTFRRYPRTRHVLLLMLAAVLENFGYRQLTLWWRVKGTVDYFRRRSAWGTMVRTGFQSSTGERR